MAFACVSFKFSDIDCRLSMGKVFAFGISEPFFFEAAIDLLFCFGLLGLTSGTLIWKGSSIFLVLHVMAFLEWLLVHDQFFVFQYRVPCYYFLSTLSFFDCFQPKEI